jgi:hypothetical protein
VDPLARFAAIARIGLIALEELPPMIVLMISTILACVALGVALAYGFCSGVFAMAKMHIRSQTAAPLQIQTKSANP